jgi:2-polyprenyl-3-methyl-5-hydroxy-6-metoxy-1,4-benzoquinol methylase
MQGERMRIFRGDDASVVDDPHDSYACVLCGGRRFQRLHHWEVGDVWNPASIPLSVWQCQCELVFLYPVPTPEQLPEQGDWWSTQRRRPKRRRAWKLLRQRASRWLFGSSQSRLINATRRAMPSGRLLDVGCGTGSLLQLASPNYVCFGLEPSPRAAEVVRAAGIPVQEAMIEQARFPPGSFDVVTMDAVIEHVRDPVDVLKHVNSLVRPGGVIALKTPKFGGPAYRMHGAAWNGFRHGYHTFLFTGETLTRTMQAAGFNVLRHPCRNRWLDDILILWGRKNRNVQRLPIPQTAPGRLAA